MPPTDGGGVNGVVALKTDAHAFHSKTLSRTIPAFRRLLSGKANVTRAWHVRLRNVLDCAAIYYRKRAATDEEPWEGMPVPVLPAQIKRNFASKQNCKWPAQGGSEDTSSALQLYGHVPRIAWNGLSIY